MRRAHMEPSQHVAELQPPRSGRYQRRGKRGSASYVFMKCLVETFGLELLRADAGVLEISAGKGELACALRNRYQVPVTCAEPRPLDLRRVVQRLRWSAESAAAGNGRHSTPVDLPENCCRSSRIFAPVHLRIFWHQGVLKDPEALARSWNLAHQVRWCASGLSQAEDLHGEEPYLSKGVPFRQLELTEYYTRPEAAASADSSCQQLPAEGEVLYDQPEDAEVDESGPGSDALCPGRAAPACGACTVVELGGGSAPPALAAVRGLCEVCSLVVALHADQAAEAAVRFAAERGKAFAVVPCCVYAEDFPQRRLSSGRLVRSLAELIEYLAALADGVEVTTLPFSGKNTVIYARPQ
ncbi:unnamed protein product [Durusdinium trenchii]|uniref:Methyltransferase domain-containing protein n=1 Tax=Durusdinium trenchii TaxID=1381693 RepID=A0ABP0MFZ3_9DINO